MPQTELCLTALVRDTFTYFNPPSVIRAHTCRCEGVYTQGVR